MPTYDYRCKKCDGTFERLVLLRDREKPQNCDHCGSEETYTIITRCNFILKGDGWPGKNYKIKNQMIDKDKRLSKRQTENKRESPKMTLAPNVEGERVDSWSEAQKLASSKGKNTTSYEPMIRAENNK